MFELNITERVVNVASVSGQSNRRRCSDKPAIYCEERVITYRHLHESVNRFGSMLRDLDLYAEIALRCYYLTSQNLHFAFLAR